MDALAESVRLGLVQVARRGDGYLVTGVSQDALVIADLEKVGAVWHERLAGWIVEDAGSASAFARMERKSKAVAAAVAARGLRAKKDGAAEYDKRRAKQIRALTRGIKDVYRTALVEHDATLKKLIKELETATDAETIAQLEARRKGVTELIEELARGLADAGKSAAQVVCGMLPEARTVSRKIAAWQIDNARGLELSRMVAHHTATLAYYRDYDKPKWTEDEIADITKLRRGYDAKAWEHIADKTKAKKLLKASISRGLLTGEHPTVIAKRIEKAFDQWEGRAVTIARTETCRVMSEAAQEYIRDADATGVKSKNRWDATLDGNTRRSHRDVDGEIVEVGKKFSNGLRRPGDGGPSESINCRCCLTPVVEGFKPDLPLRRDNITGDLIPYKTFTQWEQEQAAAGVVV